jgi:glutathione synthase/RimK-type ligase-like ATP-grasp enzyme
MIVLLGCPSDPVLIHFASFLMQHEKDCCFINQKAFGKKISFQKTHWDLEGTKLKLNNIKAVFNRLMTPPATTHQNMLASLYNWLDHGATQIINRPWQTMSNSSKMLQLQMLPERSALKKPQSHLCANMRFSPKAPTIFKSSSALRSIVTRCNQQPRHSIPEPVLLQEELAGTNIRVHVVDNQTFAVAISLHDNHIDYRYQTKSTFTPLTLPSNIAKACVDFAKACHLVFAGIDLIKCNQDYFVLEANPSPGYAYFERHLPKPTISEALCNLMEA